VGLELRVLSSDPGEESSEGNGKWTGGRKVLRIVEDKMQMSRTDEISQYHAINTTTSIIATSKEVIGGVSA
jgi:hypothetical protein